MTNRQIPQEEEFETDPAEVSQEERPTIEERVAALRGELTDSERMEAQCCNRLGEELQYTVSSVIQLEKAYAIEYRAMVNLLKDLFGEDWPSAYRGYHEEAAKWYENKYGSLDLEIDHISKNFRAVQTYWVSQKARKKALKKANKIYRKSKRKLK